MFDLQMKHLLEAVGQWAGGMSMHSASWWLPAITFAFAIGLGVRAYLFLTFRRGQRFVSEFKQRIESGGGTKDRTGGFGAALEQVLDGSLRAVFPPTASAKSLRLFRTQNGVNRLIDDTLKRIAAIEVSSSSELHEIVGEVFKSNPEFGARFPLEMAADALPRYFLVTGLAVVFLVTLGGAAQFHPGSLRSIAELNAAQASFEQAMVHCVGLAFCVGIFSIAMAVLSTFFSPRNVALQMKREFAAGLGLLRARFSQSMKASFQISESTVKANPAPATQPTVEIKIERSAQPVTAASAPVVKAVEPPANAVIPVAPVSEAKLQESEIAVAAEKDVAEVSAEELWGTKVKSPQKNLEEEMTRQTEASTPMDFDWEPEGTSDESSFPAPKAGTESDRSIPSAEDSRNLGLPSDLWATNLTESSSTASGAPSPTYVIDSGADPVKSEAGTPMDESDDAVTHHGFELPDASSPLDEDGLNGETPMAVRRNQAPAASQPAASQPAGEAAPKELNEFEFPSLVESESRSVPLSPEDVHQKADRIWQDGRDSKLIQEKIAVLLRAQIELDHAIESAYQDRLASKISEEMFQEKHKLWKATRDQNEAEIESLRAKSSSKAAA